MAKEMQERFKPGIPARQDRLFPLSEAASYPDSETLDLVLYFPAESGCRYRLWLLSESTSPEIRINEKRYLPVTKAGPDGRWIRRTAQRWPRAIPCL
jgi:hypothetical protein